MKKKKANNNPDKTVKKHKIKIEKLENLLIVVLIIALIIMFVTYIYRRITIGKSLNTNGKLVTEISNYFTTDDLNDCNGFFNYAANEVKNEDISDDIKFCIAYKKANLKDAKVSTYKEEEKSELCHNDLDMTFRIEEGTNKCQVQKVKKSVIDDVYKKTFGENPPEKEEYQAGNTHVCYLKDGYYYCGLSETFTYIYGGESSIWRITESAREKDGVITVVDYFARLEGDRCYTDFTTNRINTICTKHYTTKTKMSYHFMKKYSTKFEHIYKKAKDGTYYWVSSKPLTTTSS